MINIKFHSIFYSQQESNKENHRPDTALTTDSLVHSDEEPELQNLGSKATDQSTARSQKSPNETKKPVDEKGTPRMVNSSLKINIPQVIHF